jgi:hypothetical protein
MLTITPPMWLYVQLNARYVSIVTSALRNDYEKKAQTMMVNNSTNLIPTKRTITPHLKSFNIKKMMTYMTFWKSKSLLGTGTKCGRLNQSIGSWCLKLLCSIFVFTIQKGSDYNY